MKKSYSLTHFEHLLPIMNLKAKGYWRVQSLEILERKLKKNENSYAVLKLKNKISKVSRALPDYFRIIKCKKAKKLPNIHLIRTQKKDDLFITTQHPKKTTEPDQEKKEVVEKLFRNFPQEREIYNELEFFSTNAKKHFSPRSFNEVVEDSKKMAQFETYMKNVKKSFSTFGSKPSSYQYKEERVLSKDQKSNQNKYFAKNYPTLIGNPKYSRNNITQSSFHNKIINTASLRTKKAVQNKLRKLGYYY